MKVHRMHIGAGQPLHRGVEFGHHVIVVEEISRDRQSLRRDLVAGYFIAAAVDRV
jgi:hypothetical protein